MSIDLNSRHKQVLSLESLRRKRGYKEGWLYHLCVQKGLLPELQALQRAGMLDPEAVSASQSGAESAVGAPAGLQPLTVELVPSTCWFSNVRSEVSPEEWDRLQHITFERAGYRCEVCGSRGSAHPVECHEVWEYDDAAQVQRLAGLIALCPACHEAKHIGLASTRGRGGSARAQLARINGWSMDDVEVYLEVQFEQWSRRSQHEWKLDVSWLEQFGIHIDTTTLKRQR